MGRSLGAAVAMMAVVVAVLGGSAQHTLPAAGVGARPAVGATRALPVPGGNYCPLGTSRCTPVVPTGPPGPAPLEGVAFIVACALSVAVGRRRIHRTRSVSRLAAGVRPMILRPPIPLHVSV